MEGNGLMVLFKCHAGWEYHDATHFFLVIRFTIRPVSIRCIPFGALRDLKNGMFKNSFNEVSSLFILQVYGKARDRNEKREKAAWDYFCLSIYYLTCYIML